VGGASYLKALKAPLPHIKLVPTGGVSLQTAAGLHQGWGRGPGPWAATWSTSKPCARDATNWSPIARSYLLISSNRHGRSRRVRLDVSPPLRTPRGEERTQRPTRAKPPPGFRTSHHALEHAVQGLGIKGSETLVEHAQVGLLQQRPRYGTRGCARLAKAANHCPPPFVAALPACAQSGRTTPARDR